jgi:hypothetical protein
MITKTVDKQGRLVLGQQFANQTVIIDESDITRIVITPAIVIPAHEAWLYKNKEASDSVHKGMLQARAGKFMADPPDVDVDLAEFEKDEAANKVDRRSRRAV